MCRKFGLGKKLSKTTQENSQISGRTSGEKIRMLHRDKWDKWGSGHRMLLFHWKQWGSFIVRGEMQIKKKRKMGIFSVSRTCRFLFFKAILLGKVILHNNVHTYFWVNQVKPLNPAQFHVPGSIYSVDLLPQGWCSFLYLDLQAEIVTALQAIKIVQCGRKIPTCRHVR